MPAGDEGDLQERLISADRMADMVGAHDGLHGLRGGRPRARTLYPVLQLDPESRPRGGRAAFKRRAFKHHTDRSKDHDSPGPDAGDPPGEGCPGDAKKRLAYDRSIGIVRAAPRPRAIRPEDV
jgi:hypothetical protein